MGDPYGDLLGIMAEAGQEGRRSAFRIGTVLQAGGGALRVKTGEMALEKGDLWVDPALNWRYTEDTGGAELLRRGDRVALLTADDQDYYLICKVVKAL